MDLVQLTIQAGAVGVAIYAIHTLKTLVGNHMNHNTEAFTALIKVIGELKQVIKDYHNGKK